MDTATIAHTDRIEQELDRLRAARPALASRIDRAEHILVTQLSVSNGVRPIKVRLSGDGHSYSVASGSRLSRRYSVSSGDFSCDCPDASRRQRVCKHGIACYVLSRVGEGVRSERCYDCGERAPASELIEVQPHHLEWSFEFFGGERLCKGCARRHGLL